MVGRDDDLVPATNCSLRNRAKCLDYKVWAMLSGTARVGRPERKSKKTPNQRTSASSNICTLSVSNTSLAGGALTDIDFNNFKNITRRHVATHHNRVDKGSNGAMVHLGSIQNRYA